LNRFAIADTFVRFNDSTVKRITVLLVFVLCWWLCVPIEYFDGVGRFFNYRISGLRP
jgi:hypothetical protein